jgi:hypothetical protein
LLFLLFKKVIKTKCYEMISLPSKRKIVTTTTSIIN